MLLIGESLNVISTKIGRAFKERDSKPIQEEAIFQKEKKMDVIDINLGPAKKDGHELMPWVVQTVQEVVPDVPLALDTSNISAIEEALKVIKEVSGAAIWKERIESQGQIFGIIVYFIDILSQDCGIFKHICKCSVLIHRVQNARLKPRYCCRAALFPEKLGDVQGRSA